MDDYNLMRCNKCGKHWFMGLLWYAGTVGQECSNCGSRDIQFILAVRNNGKDLTIVNKKWKFTGTTNFPSFENINEGLIPK